MDVILDRDLTCRQFCQVVIMQRLSCFQHDVVGNIDDIVDGVHACSVQIIDHPFRRRSDLDMVDDLSVEACASFCFGSDLEAAFFTDVSLSLIVRPFHFTVQDCTDFLGHVPHAGAVSTVGRQRYIQDRIIQSKIPKNIRLTDRCVCRQFFNTVDLLLFQIFLIDAELIQ